MDHATRNSSFNCRTYKPQPWLALAEISADILAIEKGAAGQLVAKAEA